MTTRKKIEHNFSFDRVVQLAFLHCKFNAPIVENLLNGAFEALDNHPNNAFFEVTQLEVAGVHELGGLLCHLMEEGSYHGFCLFGCVVDGETHHAEHMMQSTITTTTDLQLQYPHLVIGDAILHTRTLEQAQERCNASKKRNQGNQAALALLDSIAFKRLRYE